MDHSILALKVIFLLALKLLPPRQVRLSRAPAPPILTHGVCLTRGRQSLAVAWPLPDGVVSGRPGRDLAPLVLSPGWECPGLWLPAKEDKGASPPTTKREGL